jgi:hypothetical protein
MAHALRRIYHPTRNDTTYVEDTNAVPERSDYAMTVAERVVWFVASVLMLLLAFRFLFALLGANPANSFSNFIYTTSHPFVSPFFGLFNYNYQQVGTSRVEIYTLVAMLVYAAIAYIIAQLFTIGRRR